MFKTNHNNLPQPSLIKPGEYEVIINRIYEACTRGGTEYVSIDLIVRNDVAQEYKDKHIFLSQWLSPAALPYTEQVLNKIDSLLDMPEAEYASYDDWGKAVQGKPLRVKVGHSKATDKYEAREQVNVWMSTRHPELAHVFKPQAYSDAGAPAAKGAAALDDGEYCPF